MIFFEQTFIEVYSSVSGICINLPIIYKRRRKPAGSGANTATKSKSCPIEDGYERTMDGT
jgi:hypothetical protein